MKMLMVQVVWWILFSVFVEKISQKTFAPTLGVFLVAFTFSAPLLLVYRQDIFY